MPWACEPAKPESLNADPARTGCRALVARQAAIRARLGLSAPTGAELERLQTIVLGWWAIQSWAYVGPSPDPTWRARGVWHAENSAYILGCGSRVSGKENAAHGARRIQAFVRTRRTFDGAANA